jgi:hypothetical protein
MNSSRWKRSHVVLIALLLATLPIGYAAAAIVTSPKPTEPPSVLAVGDKAGVPGTESIEEGASCADLRKTTALAGIADSNASGALGTTVFGVAGPKVRSITITVKGVARDLALSRRGAFLAVLGPDVGILDVTIVATLKDGTREVLADPAGTMG